MLNQASANIPASSSSLFSYIFATTFKAWETFVDELDDCSLFGHCVCIVMIVLLLLKSQ